jgi:hypothetical protein
MGSNNGGTSTRVREYIIERRYYELGQACEKINIELGLSAKELIMPHTLQYWKKMGFITYSVRKGGGSAKVSGKELSVIKAFAFFRAILGIEYKKLDTSLGFLSEMALGDEDKINFLLKQIDIYDSSRKQQY